jgi:predicted TIM-barrel fold metal-dependent hydrolase
MVAMEHLDRSNELHDSLGHPVIDADGHWLESMPIFLEYLREIGGPRSVESFSRYRKARWDDWYASSTAELLARRRLRSSWWTWPADTLDHATAMLPELLYKRLDEFGLDYAVIYPTLGLGIQTIGDPDLRAAVVRALNTMSAEMFAPYSDRMTPVATLSAFSPEEAIEELRFCVNELHLKTAWLHGAIRRPIPAFERVGEAGENPAFVDNLVLDNFVDYDPLWQQFVDLKVPVSTHAGSMGWGDRTSPTNYCFNHIGHFAQANHVFARALFLSGVTYRFPTLNFAFLEGGCGWAVNLVHDLIGHWEKRSREPMLRNLDPRHLDRAELLELFQTYGGRWFEGKADEMMNNLDPYYPGLTTDQVAEQEQGHELDDFAPAHVGSIDDIIERFTKTFYFGCEADDPMTAWANDPRMFARLKPIFSSDIGHFDVSEMNTVLREAHELVQYGQLNEAEFREFTFSNAVGLYTGMNPSFFDGTVIEQQVADELHQHSLDS